MNAPIQAGKALTEVIMSNFETPVINLKYSNLQKAFYYPNSPTIPRYSITCTFDPTVNKEFIKAIRSIETNESCLTSPLKTDTVKSKDGQHTQTGNVMIKFQDKVKIPVYTDRTGKVSHTEEIARDQKVVVKFDIVRYINKESQQVGLTFKPVCIYIADEPITATIPEMQLTTTEEESPF